MAGRMKGALNVRRMTGISYVGVGEGHLENRTACFSVYAFVRRLFAASLGLLNVQWIHQPMTNVICPDL